MSLPWPGVPAYFTYITYTLAISDRATYEFAVAAYGGTPDTGAQLDFSPNTACGLFSIPIPYPTGDLTLLAATITGSGTNGITPVQAEVLPGALLYPNDDDGIFIYGVAHNPPIPSGDVPGQHHVAKWRGTIAFSGGPEPTTTTPTAIPQRRWITGFEMQFSGEGGAGFSGVAGARVASRTIEGFGHAVRGNNITNSLTRTLIEYGAFTSRKSWERLYFRAITPGAMIVGFWRCGSVASTSAGAILVYTPTGTIDLYTMTSGTVLNFQMTGYTPPPGKWVKIDILLSYPSTGLENGTVLVYFNGVLTYTFTDSSGGSMDTVGFHGQSIIGKGFAFAVLGLSDAIVEYDLDDWMNAEWPLQAGVLMTDSMDFLMGSHVRKAFNISGTAVNYTLANCYNITNQMVNPSQQLGSALVSTTASALVNCVTDLPALGAQDRFAALVYGAVAAIVGIHDFNAGGNDGQLGYSVAGGGAVMTTIPETAAQAFYSVRYQPSGLIVPAEITPFNVRYTKSADVTQETIQGLQAIVEYIGIWGQEDVPDPDLYPSDIPRNNQIHNCAYPNTPYGLVTPTRDTSITFTGGIYVGNGTQQDITLPDACHMLFIRGLTVANLGVKWLACNMGAHVSGQERIFPNGIVRVWYDDINLVFKFTVTGTHAESNQVGITYQYIALCDPGMRTSCAGAFTHIAAAVAGVNTLQNPDFLPEYIMTQGENQNTSTNQNFRVKGPGNTGNIGNTINAVAIANFGTLATGVFNSLADLHTNQNQVSYIAFRSIEPHCGWVNLQIFSYTGDGAASRNITLTPASSRFPLFVLITGTTGGTHTIFRDPSHAGTNSATFDALGNTTTGITAGAVDQITVGLSLNAAGVVYNVFCMPGDSAGWNNGNFTSPNCFNEDPYFNPVMDPPAVSNLGSGGLILNGTTPLTLLKDISGIYTLVPNKTNDTLIDRQSGQASVDVKIPNPFAKTGYIGG